MTILLQDPRVSSAWAGAQGGEAGCAQCGGYLQDPAQVILASHWSILFILASHWSILRSDTGEVEDSREFTVNLNTGAVIDW